MNEWTNEIFYFLSDMHYKKCPARLELDIIIIMQKEKLDDNLQMD